MAASRVTNAEILTALTASETRREEQLGTLAGEIKGLRQEFRAMNGRVRENQTDIARLQAHEIDPPCGEHAEAITRLQEKVSSHGINWGRVWQIVQFVLTLALAAMLAKVGLGG